MDLGLDGKVAIVTAAASGIGEDRFGREFSKTGEQLNERARGQMLDEVPRGGSGVSTRSECRRTRRPRSES